MCNLKCDEFPEGEVHFEHLTCTCRKAQDSSLGTFVGIILLKKKQAKLLFFYIIISVWFFCIPAEYIKAHEA